MLKVWARAVVWPGLDGEASAAWARPLAILSSRIILEDMWPEWPHWA